MDKKAPKILLEENHSLLSNDQSSSQTIQMDNIELQNVSLSDSISECISNNPQNLTLEISNLRYSLIDKKLYCFTCSICKPVRARHCKKCKKCVRRFDHHCPWTGNCVGQMNIKFFIQFLFYSSFTLITFSIIQVIFCSQILHLKSIASYIHLISNSQTNIVLLNTENNR